MKRIERKPQLPLSGSATWIARCVDAHHPTLVGRLRCAFDEGVELWIAALQGLAVREGDRVLVTQPANGSEPVVIGVVDGFAQRPEIERPAAAKVTVHRDESLLIESADGTPLLSLHQGRDGPVARLLHDDVHLDVGGELRLSAESIALEARQGEARVVATSDVVVRGETIQLN